MKSIIKTIPVVLCCIVLAACGKSPKATAKAFTEEISKGKIEEAKKYATEPAGKFLDMAGAVAFTVNPDFEFIFVSQTIDGNRATVRFSEKPGGKEEEIKLVKLDGEWKVHMEK